MASSKVRNIISKNIREQKHKSAYLNAVAEALEENGKDGDAYRALADLLDDLSDMEDFYNGIIDYTDAVGQAAQGAKRLDDSATELLEGSVELNDGAKALSEGVETLGDGTGELVDGVDQLDEAAIQKLVDLIDGDFRTLSDRTEAMLDLMNDYPSYGGRSEEMSGVTAFVIRTEAVEAAEESVTDR